MVATIDCETAGLEGTDRWVNAMGGAAAVVLVVLGLGCGGADGGGRAVENTARLRLEAVSSDSTMAHITEFEDPWGTRFSLTSMQMRVTEISLGLPAGLACEDVEGLGDDRLRCTRGDEAGSGGRVSVARPIVVEATDGVSAPEISGLAIPAMDYKDVAVTVGPRRLDEVIDGPAEAMGRRALLTRASFAIEGRPRELVLDFSFGDGTTVHGDGGDARPLTGGDTLVLQWDAAKFLDHIPITDCLNRGDLVADGKVVRVDDTSGGFCSEAAARFETNFNDAFEVTSRRAEPRD